MMESPLEMNSTHLMDKIMIIMTTTAVKIMALMVLMKSNILLKNSMILVETLDNTSEIEEVN